MVRNYLRNVETEFNTKVEIARKYHGANLPFKRTQRVAKFNNNPFGLSTNHYFVDWVKERVLDNFMFVEMEDMQFTLQVNHMKALGYSKILVPWTEKNHSKLHSKAKVIVKAILMVWKMDCILHVLPKEILFVVLSNLFKVAEFVESPKLKCHRFLPKIF